MFNVATELQKYSDPRLNFITSFLCNKNVTHLLSAGGGNLSAIYFTEMVNICTYKLLEAPTIKKN